MPSRLLTLTEVSQRLGITYARASQLGREGFLPLVKLGRQLRVDPRKLEEFIEAGGKAYPGGWRRQAAE